MISVNYSYYNNLETFKLVRDHYLNCSNYDDYKFRIVDDGSQHKPLPESEVPGEWDHYVVENDIGWNNEGCKNLLMQETDPEWNVCLDLDRVMSPMLMKQLPEYIKTAKKDRLHRFCRVPNSNPISPNDFLVNYAYFWSKNGYAESYFSDANGRIYWGGADWTFVGQCKSEILLSFAPLYTIHKQIEEPPIDKSLEWKKLNLKPYDNGKRVNFEWKKINANLYN